MKNILSVIFVMSLISVSTFALNNKCNPPPEKQLERSQAFLQNTPCAPLMSACNSAGYILNCHSANGKGLLMDCAHPIMKGSAVSGVGIQPTDPNVAACKTYCFKTNKGACKEEKGVNDR